MKTQKKEEVKENVLKEIEYYHITLLLDNLLRAEIEYPETQLDDVINEIISAIKTSSFLDAETFGGSIEVGGEYIDSLNCGRVIGLIY